MGEEKGEVGEEVAEPWGAAERRVPVVTSWVRREGSKGVSRHRNRLLNRQRNCRDSPPGSELGRKHSRAPADRAEGWSLPELQQTAAGEPNASTRRETHACITSIYF
ncbi:hypothetical protein NQZ68_007910 [Dissostichus eleginoides]|nr:hypothetical protein NQZ68_007910 [Dissostichus eleginoides]